MQTCGEYLTGFESTYLPDHDTDVLEMTLQFVDSTDWDSLLCRADGHVDPVCVYWLDGGHAGLQGRRASELSELYRRLARGEIGSKALPAYRFQEPVLTQLEGFLP